MRERVLSVAKQLNYETKALAANFAARRSGFIGVATPFEGVIRSSYLADAFKGFQRAIPDTVWDFALFDIANTQSKCNVPGLASSQGGGEAAMRKSYCQLSADERVQIATLRSQAAPRRERPATVESRCQQGHREIDTVLGTTRDGVVTPGERQTGYLLVGKRRARTTAELNRATFALMCRHPERFRTITADHGTEFHDHRALEAVTGVPFYFATPHHPWERGTNETPRRVAAPIPAQRNELGVTDPKPV